MDGKRQIYCVTQVLMMITIYLSVVQESASGNFLETLYLGIDNAAQKFFTYREELNYHYDYRFNHYFIPLSRDYKANLPLRIYIHKNIPAHKRNIIRQAIQIWSHYIPMREWADTSGMTVEIKNVMHIRDEQKYHSLGYTKWCKKSKSTKQVEIQLKNSLSSNDVLLWVMLHELGHAVGIMNHSSNPKDIMYPFYPKKVLSRSIPNKPSPQDLNTLKLMYDGHVACHFESFVKNDQERYYHIQKCLPGNEQTTTYRFNSLKYSLILFKVGYYTPAIQNFIYSLPLLITGKS